MVPHPARSACEEHSEWIEAQAQLGRNAQSIYQDLVEQHGFTHRYNSVKRFVRTLKVREPERFDPSRETARLLEKVKKIGPRTRTWRMRFLLDWGGPDRRPSMHCPTLRDITSVNRSNGLASGY